MLQTASIIAPKRPVGPGWVQGAPLPTSITMGYDAETWQFPARGLFVISAVEVAATEPGSEPLGPEYHLSVTRHVRGQAARCSSADARWVLAQFDLADSDEDNHTPHGLARHFWRPVADHLSGIQCPCKDDEPAIAEDKGDYIWRGITR